MPSNKHSRVPRPGIPLDVLASPQALENDLHQRARWSRLGTGDARQIADLMCGGGHPVGQLLQSPEAAWAVLQRVTDAKARPPEVYGTQWLVDAANAELELRAECFRDGWWSIPVADVLAAVEQAAKRLDWLLDSGIEKREAGSPKPLKIIMKTARLPQ